MTTHIELAGTIYHVRTVEKRTEVYADGQWMFPNAFVDYLVKNGKKDELKEIWKFYKTKRERTK